ncbi:hypothetical protein [Amphritea sp.]|uniref:hypothetical protein n=1 Tax=Amphritea sp. TaxID=1872502 RepID=UPI003D1365C6
MSSLCKWPPGQLCLTPAAREQAVRQVEKAFASTLESLKVDIGLVELLESIYVPLGAWLVARKEQQQGPLVVGINGAQGAGKSTLFNLLEVILEEGFDLKVVGLSIDDLYKTREDREQLAHSVHPLLKTRGVPGTHDVDLGLELLRALKGEFGEERRNVKIPVFDKSIDDRCPPALWQEWHGKADVIVLEGWCVGASAQSESQLAESVNDLERSEDPLGFWRNYVNQQLEGSYKELFGMIDVLIMLKVPSMESVFEWRSQQEKKLAERVRYFYDTQQPTQHLRIMNEREIRRFIQHYERLTRNMLEEMPGRADVCLELNQNHKIGNIRINKPL